MIIDLDLVQKNYTITTVLSILFDFSLKTFLAPPRSGLSVGIIAVHLTGCGRAWPAPCLLLRKVKRTTTCVAACRLKVSM